MMVPFRMDIGVGPANRGLSALPAPDPGIATRFFERRPRFTGHDGTMLPGAALLVGSSGATNDDLDGGADTLDGHHSPLHGPAPEYVACADRNDGIVRLAEALKQWRADFTQPAADDTVRDPSGTMAVCLAEGEMAGRHQKLAIIGASDGSFRAPPSSSSTRRPTPPRTNASSKRTVSSCSSPPPEPTTHYASPGAENPAPPCTCSRRGDPVPPTSPAMVHWRRQVASSCRAVE
ncbi:hypothetical protein ASE09_15330 [Streptomyces sp. Root66D1]|nr:hypothetical protein ASD33_20375 [Streptomyces sp. Root1304]KRA82458.1 hypothetical protein ASE09_15330 [Streptomyces sp. Root66D1]